jgi:hypothetical protein
LVVALVAGVGLAGCATEASMPAVAYPSASVGAQLVVQVPVTPAPSYTGYAPPLGAIAVRFSGLQARTRMHYPMGWLTFSVTLTNTSGFAFRSLDPLLVFGQCTCTPANYGIAPSSSLQLWDAAAAGWKPIQSSELNSRQTYKYVPQLGSIDLGPHAAVTYKYRIQLSRTAGRMKGLVDGTGSLSMYVLQLPKHTRVSVGLDPEASVPLTYSFP